MSQVLQSGIMTIGSNQDGSNIFNFSVTFNKKFNSQPVCVANTLQDPNHSEILPDTFAVSISSISNTGVEGHVWRVDQSGQRPQNSWAQDLRLCWMASSKE